MITVETLPNHDATLVQVSGRVDSLNASQLGDALAHQIRHGCRLVLDLADVDYMSSAGLREIVMALKKVQREAGDLRIAQPSLRVQEVFELSGLDTLLQIFPNRDAALAGE